MDAKTLKNKFFDFFTSRGHKLIKSAPLLPENDPTVLFTTAGMHPLVPYLMGSAHPAGKRLVNCQKCVRTGDIDEVGDEVHLTFFEMLGNWSLGDYFKEDAIRWSYEFLTSEEWLGIEVSLLAVTVFAGDDDAPFDAEAYDCWLDLGIPESRIAKMPKSDNWWGPAGQTGPCGPDTEMFYWSGEGPAPEKFDPEDSRWVEIWNDVFMQYNKTAEGSFEPLAQRNVDTGMGLERVVAVLRGKSSCYETDLFKPLFAALDGARGVEAVSVRTKSERIVVDHMRSASFIMADGVVPGNVDQAYVVRRLIRRAIREGRKLGVAKAFIAEIAAAVIDNYAEFYPELAKNRTTILSELETEERQFAQTLEKGLREFEKLIAKVPPHVQRKMISGKNAFFLYETYGFPLELTEDMAAEKGFEVDRAGFGKAYAKHQEMSRQGAERKFKGGLADEGEATAKLHTATHIMLKALRQVLGGHVEQKGSNITAERLRFDFSHPDKVAPDQLAEVERIVNEIIQADLPVSCEEMTVDEAEAKNAIGVFGDRYGETVKVYGIGDFSLEICGGPHAERTGGLGVFKIKKESSSSRGVRRIKAVLTG